MREFIALISRSRPFPVDDPRDVERIQVIFLAVERLVNLPVQVVEGKVTGQCDRPPDRRLIHKRHLKHVARV